jgi:hypothetical protein
MVGTNEEASETARKIRPKHHDSSGWRLNSVIRNAAWGNHIWRRR